MNVLDLFIGQFAVFAALFGAAVPVPFLMLARKEEARCLPPAQPDCAKCKSELANKIRGQQDNLGMLTENDKGRNWGLEWAAQIVEGKRR